MVEGIRIQIFQDEDEDIIGNLVAADSSEAMRRHVLLSSIFLVLGDIYTAPPVPLKEKKKATMVAERLMSHSPAIHS
jgi:hypothetical protein